MQPHMKPLTGLRGIAALWVVALHGATYVDLSSVIPEFLSNFVGKGWIGVDLFFILSGFIISYVHQSEFSKFNHRTAGRFLLLRLARIYPAHAVATLVLVPIVLGGTMFSLYQIPAAEGYGFDRLLHSLTLTIGWGIPESAGWNWPSWSVGAEWFAYMLFPFIACGLNRVNTVKAFIGIVAAVLATMYIAAFLLNDGKQYMPDGAVSLLRVSSAFLIGCCVYNVHCRLEGDERHASILAAILVLSIVILSSLQLPAIFDGVFIVLFSVLIPALARSHGVIARLLSGKAMMYLGAISYSIYLTHYTVLIIVNKAFEFSLEKHGIMAVGELSYLILFYATYGIGALISGHFLYTWIEQPCRIYIRDNWLNDPQQKRTKSHLSQIETVGLSTRVTF